MMIFRAPVFAATIALLVIAFVAFGLPGIVGVIIIGFLARGL